MIIDNLKSRTIDTILSVNPGHDGAVAAVREGKLLFSWEAEQDCHSRHAPASACFLLNALSAVGNRPTVIARSGWHRDRFSHQGLGVPYHGINEGLVRQQYSTIFGEPTLVFESTHERAHIFASYGMSPFPQGEPCYALVWEGEIGSFYELDAQLRIRRLGPVVRFPGYKYSFLYDLADPEVTEGGWGLDAAGKLMALAGFSRQRESVEEERQIIHRVLSSVMPPFSEKKPFEDSPYFNCGVTEPSFCDLVARFSDVLFDKFYTYAKNHFKRGLPLIIGGGCGLNCEWNSRWRDSGLFSDVFVPPVPNDSGVPIGTAVEAQWKLAGNAKIQWSVYSGQECIWDGGGPGFVERPLNLNSLAELLLQGKVVGWMSGRSEIGPRALGNRSILASPFQSEMRDQLNRIKQREWYRPIAPVCMQEEALRLFGVVGESPYMLYFQPSCASELSAVTHVDGSARVQTVTQQQNPRLYQLLSAFKRLTGFGVLCNTSLNMKAMGFINRSGDLFKFGREHGLDILVFNERVFVAEAVVGLLDCNEKSGAQAVATAL